MEKLMVNMAMEKQPLPIDFLVPTVGKKFMNNKTTRALQSKISLKFSLAAIDQDKVKIKPAIKQSIIDDFEEAYKVNCDQDRQRTKNRMVSEESFFHPVNKPPKEYYVPDYILEKPGRINIRDVNAPIQPLAGRLTEIG